VRSLTNVVFIGLCRAIKLKIFVQYVRYVCAKGCSTIAEKFYMKFSRLQNHILKLFAVVTASLMLPGLALAGTDNGKGNDGQNNGNQYGKTKNGDPAVSSVPEANPAIVLIPFVGAVLLVSSLQLLRRRSC
jgi:hypothetical protein